MNRREKKTEVLRNILDVIAEAKISIEDVEQIFAMAIDEIKWATIAEVCKDSGAHF